MLSQFLLEMCMHLVEAYIVQQQMFIEKGSARIISRINRERTGLVINHGKLGRITHEKTGLGGSPMKNLGRITHEKLGRATHGKTGSESPMKKLAWVITHEKTGSESPMKKLDPNHP